MKFLLTSSAIFMLFATTFFSGGLASCTKDRNEIKDFKHHRPSVDTVWIGDTIIIVDTLRIGDTVFTEEMLTAHPWKFQELRAVYGGAPLYYLRGGASNNSNYDNEYVVFNPDHTGYEYDAAGYFHNIPNWGLTTTDKVTLTFTYFNAPGVTSLITWDRIQYKNGNMLFEDYYLDNYVNLNYHGYEIRMPK